MPKLFMLLIGCSPNSRNIEQHDVFFGIAESLKELVPAIQNFWPDVKGVHVDAWREVRCVNGYEVKIVERQKGNGAIKLFFLNLGGYKSNEFEEFHYKMIVAAPGKGDAVAQAKRTAFFKHTGFKGATAHIDDKFGVDVDDFFEITDILPEEHKQQWSLSIEPVKFLDEDEIHLGYFKLDSFK